MFNEPLCGGVVAIIKTSAGNGFQTDFDLLSALSGHIARYEGLGWLVVPNRIAQRMIMKNLSIVVGASEAIEQLIVILEAHEAEEKDKPFLQREHQ